MIQGRAAGIGITTSKAESSINADKLAITPTTAQDTNKSNSSGQDSSDDQKRDERRKSSSANVVNKKNSVEQNKSKNAKNNKKDDNANIDKSERSSSPAFESDEDSSGNDKQQPVQTLVVPVQLNKKRPSIAGLLVS
jgi:hypothetical protein